MEERPRLDWGDDQGRQFSLLFDAGVVHARWWESVKARDLTPQGYVEISRDRYLEFARLLAEHERRVKPEYEHGARWATLPQRRFLYSLLSQGTLQARDVGDVEALTVGRASELIELGLERLDRGPLGFAT